MSFNTDLEMAYHMGYDDALARRKPDASKVQVFGRGMTNITENFRRRIADAERVLPLVGDTPPQVRIRLDFLKEMLDEIDAEHERRMEQARGEGPMPPVEVDE